MYGYVVLVTPLTPSKPVRLVPMAQCMTEDSAQRLACSQLDEQFRTTLVYSDIYDKHTATKSGLQRTPFYLTHKVNMIL